MNVALKIQRRRYAREATWEIYVHHLARKGGRCPELIGLHEYFLHDGHVCMAFERHGSSLENALGRGPLPVARVRRVTRQILAALARLHACGYAHTDVKPDNILYDGRTGDARLADLGSARTGLRRGSHPGTREYMAPEILIGAPLSCALDLWSLGCTVFEMLTGHLLFSPRRAAAKKYREFAPDAQPVELDPSVHADDAVEAAEQYPKGTVIAGKYELQRRLGQGRFGTVWAASELHSRPIGGDYKPVWTHAMSAAAARPPSTPRERADERWRDRKGADDLLDLALRYEHSLLVGAHCGPFPARMIRQAKYRKSFFESDGAHRFRPEIHPMSIRERLRRGGGLRGDVLKGAVDFLNALVQVDPARRVSADDALEHPWLTGSGSAAR